MVRVVKNTTICKIRPCYAWQE